MRSSHIAISLLACATFGSAHAASTIRLTLTNLTPAGGNIVSQTSVLLHRGDYDVFNTGAPASQALERQGEDALRTIAEGSPQPGLLDVFAPYAATNSGARGVAFNGPTMIPTLGATFQDFLPGESASATLLVDELNANNAFLSLAFMFLPSNDAFWANESPTAYRLFNADGSFNPIDFTISGSDILDLGTEANEEIRATTAALAQQFPDVGTVETGVIRTHPGYNAPNGNFADGGVLDDPTYANANFKVPGYQVARVQVDLVSGPGAVPEPTTWAMLITGFGAVGASLRRRRRAQVRA